MSTKDNQNKEGYGFVFLIVIVALLGAVFVQWLTGVTYLETLDSAKSYSYWDVFLGRICEGEAGVSLTVLFGVAGVFGSILTTVQLNKIGELSVEQAKKARELSSAQQIEIERITTEGIKNIEDATRHSLEGFASIFARAILLLNKSTKEKTFYVNFAASFGLAHFNNEEVKEAFISAIKHDDIQEIIDSNTTGLCGNTHYFRKGIVAFRTLLKNVAKQADGDFTGLLLDGDRDVKTRFLNRLTTLDSNEVETAYREEMEFRKSMASTVKDSLADAQTDPHKGFEIGFSDKITTQYLITKIDKSESGGRWGCLVFFIGTDNVGRGVVPRGYYTELESMAKLHISQINESLGRNEEGRDIPGATLTPMLSCCEWESKLKTLGI